MTQADEQVAEVVTYLVSAGQHVAEVSREGAGQFAGYRLAAGEYQLAIWLDDEDTSIVEWVARLTVGDTRAVWHCWVRADGGGLLALSDILARLRGMCWGSAADVGFFRVVFHAFKPVYDLVEVLDNRDESV